jgi:hypothetical protein
MCGLLNDADIYKLCGCKRDPYLKKANNEGVDRVKHDDDGGKAADRTSSHDSPGKSVSGFQGCEINVNIKCIPPKDSGSSSCDELFHARVHQLRIDSRDN